MTYGNLVEGSYLPVSINIAVFNVSSHRCITKILKRRICHLIIIYKQPLSYKLPLLGQGITYLRLTPFGGKFRFFVNLVFTRGKREIPKTGYPKVAADIDRKSVVSGKSVSVRVNLGGLRIIKKKK